MKPDVRLRLSAALFALAVSAALPVAAQEVAPSATPNADRLAEEMRTLARDPRNLRALVSAGELSARLNDPSAAAGFFARAQAIDPTNPRVLAGQAMVMVRMERPGEALRLFGEAERRGLSMEDYASDRGLAYDLVGAQPQALREHRAALRRNPDDETRRRLALSLGISGNSGEAMAVLDPLLRRSDRAAWRARAFILAMNGDAAGADKIAASMMGGVGTALAPFFRRLPTLNAADKAFAVHFGELRKTPARIADAQLAPPLPRVAGETGVVLASAEPPRRLLPAPVETRRGPVLNAGGRSAAARRREQEELARKTAAEAEARRVAEARAAQERETQRLAELKAQQEREALAARQRDAERLAAEQQAARDAETRRVAEAQARERATAEQAARDTEARRVAAASQPAVSEPAAVTPAETAPVETPTTQVAATPPPAPGFDTASPAESLPAQSAQATPSGPRIGGEDNVIARIIAGITIPASELGVEPMPNRRPPEPAPAAQLPAAAPPPVEIARTEPPKLRPEPKAEPAKPKPETAKPETPKAGARGKTVDPKTADAKASDAKAAATKAAAKTKAKPDPAKTEPARHWAQVAGGANVGDLPKAWRGLVAKAPAEFKGRQAWTTPLRFTNRLLVGPFKTPGETQAFVNAIGKKGISAFAWTSEAGQKIEKLAVK